MISLKKKSYLAPEAETAVVTARCILAASTEGIQEKEDDEGGNYGVFVPFSIRFR